MLVTFSSDAYENITMFGDVATHLLTMMGQSGLVPGAILAEEVPIALQQLEESLGRIKKTSAQQNDDDDVEPAISIRHRALPLIKLLQASAKAQCDVLWTSN
jgi:hypothetical protein